MRVGTEGGEAGPPQQSRESMSGWEGEKERGGRGESSIRGCKTSTVLEVVG